MFGLQADTNVGESHPINKGGTLRKARQIKRLSSVGSESVATFGEPFEALVSTVGASTSIVREIDELVLPVFGCTIESGHEHRGDRAIGFRDPQWRYSRFPSEGAFRL